MIKPDDPRQLAIDILERSICQVKVGACIADQNGIMGWGWNSVGDGFGEHAEAAAIRRSNRRRQVGATIYVAARRNNIITAKPCEDCARRIYGSWISKVVYRDQDGWKEYSVD
jgi:deoxycytidylate deaminase